MSPCQKEMDVFLVIPVIDWLVSVRWFGVARYQPQDYHQLAQSRGTMLLHHVNRVSLLYAVNGEQKCKHCRSSQY